MSMQKQENDKKFITLVGVFPDSPPEKVICDHVSLTVKDSLSGKNGGQYGIRPGHASAVFLLDEGPVEAYLEGKLIWSKRTSEGFAKMMNNTLTLVTELAPSERKE